MTNPRKTLRERIAQTLDSFTERSVERFTHPGSLVCDPFCGAGSTGVSALVLDRAFLGFDIEQSCIEQTAERLSQMAVIEECGA